MATLQAPKDLQANNHLRFRCTTAIPHSCTFAITPNTVEHRVFHVVMEWLEPVTSSGVTSHMLVVECRVGYMATAFMQLTLFQSHGLLKARLLQAMRASLQVRASGDAWRLEGMVIIRGIGWLRQLMQQLGLKLCAALGRLLVREHMHHGCIMDPCGLRLQLEHARRSKGP